LRPEVLAGSLPLLRGLAAQVLAGVLEPPPLKLAVVAFTGPRDGLLTEDDRNELWTAFKVPVLAKLHGFHRELVGWECEAQEGLHLEPGSAVVETVADSGELAITCLDNFECPCLRVRTGLAAEITSAPCHCGRPGDRLMDLRPLAEELAARAACAAD
jgi:phenylacetate-coenzyme A ligase PaaK-like adenylate-forming protein